MKRAYILLADGFECVEALAPIDVMFRAGVDLRRIAIGGKLDVASSHNLVSLKCHTTIEKANLSDGCAIILPGGNPGYINLRESEAVCRAVREYYNSGRLVAAICGAPTVLAAADIAKDRAITCHSSVIGQMGDYKYVGSNVVEDGNLITSSGAGHAIEFAIAVAARIVDSETLSRTRQGMEL